jgi:hypothetical protein
MWLVVDAGGSELRNCVNLSTWSSDNQQSQQRCKGNDELRFCSS